MTCVWGIEMGKTIIFFPIRLVLLQILLLQLSKPEILGLRVVCPYQHWLYRCRNILLLVLFSGNWRDNSLSCHDREDSEYAIPANAQTV